MKKKYRLQILTCVHSTVVRRHAWLREIGCLKIVKLFPRGDAAKRSERNAQHLFLLYQLSFSLSFSPRRYEPWKSHLFSCRGMIRSAQRMHGFTHLCVPARPPRTAWRENAGETWLVMLMRKHTR